MDERLEDLRSRKNPKARIKIMKGHFATSHSHLDTYIDMSTVKTRHNNARETAKTLAEEYLSNISVNSIVCLDATEVIGTFMAECLADSSRQSLSYGNNISVITPEFDALGQILFRDNNQRMIRGQQVLILAASIVTGVTVNHAIQSVLYYGGSVCGVSSIFSAVTKIRGMEVNTIFEIGDLPQYHAYKPENCPMCQADQRVEALVNSYGYSKL